MIGEKLRHDEIVVCFSWDGLPMAAASHAIATVSNLILWGVFTFSRVPFLRF